MSASAALREPQHPLLEAYVPKDKVPTPLGLMACVDLVLESATYQKDTGQASRALEHGSSEVAGIQQSLAREGLSTFILRDARERLNFQLKNNLDRALWPQEWEKNGN